MYRIIVKKKAKKFIDKLPINERKRIAYAIEQLPNGEDIKKLKGHDELLRLRVGEYRIIYSVDNGELIVYVVDAGNRGDIYKRYQEAVKITIGEKIKVILEYRHMTVQELSIKMGYNSPSALYNRFKRDNFSESDLQEMCKILNCSYDVIIKMNDNGKEV